MDSKDTGQGAAPSAGRGWDGQIAHLLENWHMRVYAAQSAQYASADLFRLLSDIVGVPAVVFASIVGTVMFADRATDRPKALAVGAVSIVAAVLAALQTFLRFSERAAQHATATDWYSAIPRDIEETLHLPVESRGKAEDCLDRVRKEMNRVTQDAPELSVRMWKRGAKRFGAKEPLELQ